MARLVAHDLGLGNAELQTLSCTRLDLLGDGVSYCSAQQFPADNLWLALFCRLWALTLISRPAVKDVFRLGLVDLGLEQLGMPILTRSGSIVVLWIWWTGGLHLDGAMDTADGLAVQDAERRLAVLGHLAALEDQVTRIDD